MIFVGIDEVGRGCVAGPVVACAVVINKNFNVPVTDSKLLTKNKRDVLEKSIKLQCMDFNISIVDEKIIDEVNIHNASLIAMKNAFMGLGDINQDKIVRCDGKFIPDIQTNITAHVKGDLIFPEISAASIIAKVYRDFYMSSISRKYSEYGFDQHKGYLTQLHLDAIKKFGPCPIHRKSFKPFS